MPIRTRATCFAIAVEQSAQRTLTREVAVDAPRASTSREPWSLFHHEGFHGDDIGFDTTTTFSPTTNTRRNVKGSQTNSEPIVGGSDRQQMADAMSKVLI